MSIYFIVSMIIMLGFLAGIIIFILLKPDKYAEEQQFIRKFFYFIFVVFLIAGVLTEEIDITDWQILTVLIVFSVFVDLTILQTPDITKFWNAEFQQSSYVRRTIQKNKEVLRNTEMKVQNFTDIISNTPSYFEDKVSVTNWRKYKEELVDYLNQYADTFQFNIAIFAVETVSTPEELYTEIERVFNKVVRCYNKSITDSDWQNELIQKLSSGQSIEFINKDEDIGEDFKKGIWIVAYYGQAYNMLIGIRSSGIEVNGVDASHILNLAEIFDWHMIE